MRDQLIATVYAAAGTIAGGQMGTRANAEAELDMACPEGMLCSCASISNQ